MKNDAKNNVRDWTEEDERKYRKMLATPVKRLTEEEMLKLAAVSPYPPLGAGNVSRKMDENENTLTKNENMVKETKTNQDLDFNKLAEMQKENREIMENLKQATETPFFGNEDKFAQTIAEAGIKAAKATHEFNMKEIKARLIADLCKELVKTPMRYTDVPQRAREIADKALQTATENASVSQIAHMQRQIDTFKAALLHINERINNGNKCNLVYTEPLDVNDKHFINNIIRFIDEHTKTEQQ